MAYFICKKVFCSLFLHIIVQLRKLVILSSCFYKKTMSDDDLKYWNPNDMKLIFKIDNKEDGLPTNPKTNQRKQPIIEEACKWKYLPKPRAEIFTGKNTSKESWQWGSTIYYPLRIYPALETRSICQMKMFQIYYICSHFYQYLFTDVHQACWSSPLKTQYHFLLTELHIFILAQNSEDPLNTRIIYE